MKRVISLVFILLMLATPVAARTYWVERDYSSHLVVDEREYPVIFVPGFGGSELWLGDDIVWPGPLEGALGYDSIYNHLALEPNGKKPLLGEHVLARKTMRYGHTLNSEGTVDLGFTSFNSDVGIEGVYAGWFDYMAGEGFYYHDYRDLDEIDHKGKLHFDFPYDWRQDNRRFTKLLEKKVQQVLDQTRAEKVILVGHSMGGLQIRLFMNNPKNHKYVAAVVFMGTPHGGSAKAYYGLANGYNFGNMKISDRTMWEVAGNWPAAYQLLPRQEFIEVNGEMWSLEQTYGDGWMTEEELWQQKDAKAKGTPRLMREGLPNRKFAESVVDWGKELGTTLPDYGGPWYMIEGIEQNTTTKLLGTLEDTEFGIPVLKLKEEVTTKGDGTVPHFGATVGGLTETFEVKAGHMYIPTNKDAQDHFTRIRREINNEEFRFGYASKINGIASERLEEIRGWQLRSEEPRGLRIFLDFLFQRKSGERAEKISFRDELRSHIRALVMEGGGVTITVAPNTDKEDVFWIVFDKGLIVDSGPGEVRDGRYKVTVDSYDTIDQISRGDMGVSYAYNNNHVKVRAGLSNNLKLMIFKWISSYGTGSN